MIWNSLMMKILSLVSRAKVDNNFITLDKAWQYHNADDDDDCEIDIRGWWDLSDEWSNLELNDASLYAMG